MLQILNVIKRFMSAVIIPLFFRTQVDQPQLTALLLDDPGPAELLQVLRVHLKSLESILSEHPESIYRYPDSIARYSESISKYLKSISRYLESISNYP